MNKNVILVMALPLLLDADCATSADFGADVSQSPTVLTVGIPSGAKRLICLPVRWTGQRLEVRRTGPFLPLARRSMPSIGAA